MVIVILGILATFRMPTDIFPEINRRKSRGRVSTAGVLRDARLWPSLSAVENTIDFDELIADAINGQKGKARKNKLAGAWVAAWAAAAWKLC